MKNSTKRMVTIAGVGMFAVSFVTSVTFVSVKNEKSDVSSLFARNIEALARNEDKDNCGSSTTYYNEALRDETCEADPGYSSNHKSRLKCVEETDKCCDSNSQTTCSSQW